MDWNFARHAYERLTGMPPVASEEGLRNYVQAEAFELDTQTLTPHHRYTNCSETDRERLRDLIDVANALGHNLTLPDKGGWG